MYETGCCETVHGNQETEGRSDKHVIPNHTLSLVVLGADDVRPSGYTCIVCNHEEIAGRH